MRESVKIIKQCLAKMKPGPVKVQDRKFSPPHARRDEALDGSADPPLQALHRRLSRAGRRDLHGGGKPEGRVRRLSGRRRHQQAVSLQDPPDRLRLPAGDRCDGESGTCWPMSARSSDRSTSCSARSTGRPWPKATAPTFEQPAHFAFDAESEAEIAAIVAKYPPGRQASAVIPALYVAQNQMKRQTGSAWIPGRRWMRSRTGSAWRRSASMRSRRSTSCSTPRRSASTICSSARRRRAGCAAPTK